jgi:hypothetical protein
MRSIRMALDAHAAQDGRGPLDDVHAATLELGARRAAAEGAEAEWWAAIAGAQRVTDVAAAAGISRERVYQIRDGRR